MTFPRVFPLSLALVLVLQAHGASAQQASDEDELALVYGDQRSVSIATGSTQTLRRAPAVATVITAADIAASGATDLDQVLESVPGLHVNRGAGQYAPLYVVRGIVSQFTPQLLVLQNGIPMTTLFQGNKGNLWGGYPVEHIARIEVIRGPGSALYGADAYSGVVNIITKTGADAPGAEIGARAGSFKTRDGWLQYGGKLGAVDLSAYLRAGHTDGIRRIVEKDAQSRNDTLFGTQASLAPGPVNTMADSIDANLDLSYGKWRLRGGLKLRDKLGTGAGIASALDPVGRSKSERITADLSWTDLQLSQDWGAGVLLSSLRYVQLTPVDYQLLPPGTTFPTGIFPTGMTGGPDTWEQQVRLSGFVSYSGWRGHHIRAGLGHDDLDLYRTRETRNLNYTAGGTPIPLPQSVDFTNTNPFLFPQRRRNDYVYLQDEWLVAPDWTVTAGVRHDSYSDFGGTTNPRLALVWDASLDLTAKLLYGRAFRAPAFVESYGIANPVVLGNHDLKPETNSTLESVFAWQARADTQLTLTLFRYQMHDIIRTVPNAVAGTGATYRNAGDQSGHGAEFEAIYTVSRELRIAGNYSLQHSIDKTSEKDAGYAPRHHAYVHADYTFASGVQLGAQLNRVAGRKRTFNDLRKPIADYTTVDLSLRTSRPRGNWDFSATVFNLFGADVREPSLAPGLQIPFDLPMARRAFSVQASYRL